MNSKPGFHLVKGKAAGPDIAESVTEDFSSFAVETRFEPDVYTPTPHNMYIRVHHGAGPNYLPDAHITSIGRQHAIAMQLGALVASEGPDSSLQTNYIVFDFPSGVTRQIDYLWITLNIAFEDVLLIMQSTYFDPDKPLPEIPGERQDAFETKKGDMIYGLALQGLQTLVSLKISVYTRLEAEGYPTELPIIIKEVSWRFADGNK